MPNIRVDTSYSIADGSEVIFVAPCDCNEISGLKVYSPNGAKVFTFRDAHGNDLTGLGHLFAAGAYVKAILDVTNGYAYIQNADTNGYLEDRIRTQPGEGVDSIVQVNTAGDDNVAYSPGGAALGMNTVAGVKGFCMIEVDPENLLITVDDAGLAEKAAEVYSVGDALQFDANNHHYFKLEIVSLATNTAGHSVIGVKQTTEETLNLALDADPTENYCWVVGKNYGEIFNMAWAAHSKGENAIAAGRCARAEGRDTKAIGNYAHAEGRKTIATYVAHAEGYNTKAFGNYAHAEGYNATASGYASHAEGSSTASGQYAHAEGCGNQATGNYAHAEGRETKATGGFSHTEGELTQAQAAQAHAEGYKTVASGIAAHAEGNTAKATGNASHAEGGDTEAIGSMSHAEGHKTVAKGNCAHAEGQGTIATAMWQHVEGRYNVEDTENKYAHIVGGGTSNTDRKNIHTLDWAGNAMFAGDHIEIGGVKLSADMLSILQKRQATSLVDRTYTEKPIYSNYGAPDIENPNDFNNIAAWRYTDDKTEIELRSLPVSVLADALRGYLGGSNAGMLREFIAYETNIESYQADKQKYRYNGKASRLYTITVKIGYDRDPQYSTISIDYSALDGASSLKLIVPGLNDAYVSASLDSDGVTFQLYSNTLASLYNICGYY